MFLATEVANDAVKSLHWLDSSLTKSILPSGAWGDAGRGGNSDNVKSELTGGVFHVVGIVYAFAAIKRGKSDSAKSELQGGVLQVKANVLRLRSVGLGCVRFLWLCH